MKTAAIYARVSSDKQREENTIASQTAALVAFAREQQFEVPQEWVFEDDGYSGASLIRPGLERVRDLAADIERSSARVIHYYRCLGSDAWRRLSGSVCNNHPVRQDLLDEVVWTEIVRLLEDPQLIQNELIDGSQPHERPTRPNAEKRLSDAISFASVRISIVCSPPIRKAFSRWMNCASAYRICGGANRQTTLKCRRSSISQSIAQPTCASLKR